MCHRSTEYPDLVGEVRVAHPAPCGLHKLAITHVMGRLREVLTRGVYSQRQKQIAQGRIQPKIVGTGIGWTSA